MEGMRQPPENKSFAQVPCCRCGAGDRYWDHIAGKAYCPNCLEALAIGEADPVIEQVEKCRCAICFHLGTVKYMTVPLHSSRPVEMDLCAVHLRGLIGRRLGPHAFEQLRRQLTSLGLDVADIFLLHEAFYDVHGRAIQPAIEGM